MGFHNVARLLGIQLTVVQSRQLFQLLLGSACPFHGTGRCFGVVGSVGTSFKQDVLYRSTVYRYVFFDSHHTDWISAQCERLQQSYVET